MEHDTTSQQEMKMLSSIKVFQKPEFKKKNLELSIEALLKSFSALEYYTLQTLLESKYALSVRKLRRLVVYKLVNDVVESGEIKKSDEDVEALLTRTIKGPFVISPRHTVQFFPKTRPLTEKNFEEIIKNLNDKYALDLPSYYRIKNVLEELGSMDLVHSRKGKIGKAEEVWYINPIFYKLYSLIEK